MSHISPAPTMTQQGSQATLSLSAVSKRFGAATVLSEVSIAVAPGEIHCLLGENGAGKSTLCNLVFGVHQPDAGSMTLAGQPFTPKGPGDALSSGIAMVHQHFSLVGRLNTLQNLMLGRSGFLLDPQTMAGRIAEIAREFELRVNLRTPVEELSVGERQQVEILKCLLGAPRLLVLDEPTAVLPPREVASLLAICRKVSARGCSIILVTHKLAEISQVAHRTTVLRRGKVVETVSMAGADTRALVRAMIGRDVSALDPVLSPPSKPAVRAASALVIEGLQVRDAAETLRLDVDLEVKCGEIVGIAGVEGNGQSELGAVLAGLLAPVAGRISVAGTDVTGWTPAALRRAGVGIVPEDRHAVGCIVDLSIAENLFLGSLERFTRLGLLRREAMRAAAAELMARFDVRAAGPDAPMASLSGGNQQKVVLARELSISPLVFLLAAQPTRGLDVGAIEAVYDAIKRARDGGTGVLLVSSELDELMAVADRIVVMYRGRIVGQLSAKRENLEAIGAMMSGQEQAA
jgi:ABC-type uncharacterized transport system ATPase subunit